MPTIWSARGRRIVPKAMYLSLVRSRDAREESIEAIMEFMATFH